MAISGAARRELPSELSIDVKIHPAPLGQPISWKFTTVKIRINAESAMFA
jgi:hypothetical protein